jgi:hypothetical protein
VRRDYQKGEVIFTAGDYGSTAFLMLEGTALATIPERAQAVPVAGRTPRSFDFLAHMFGRCARPTSGGRREDVLHVEPASLTGVQGISTIIIAADGKAYA